MLPCMTEELGPTKPSFEEMKTTVLLSSYCFIHMWNMLIYLKFWFCPGAHSLLYLKTMVFKNDCTMSNSKLNIDVSFAKTDV